jgi:hypothetical protein
MLFLVRPKNSPCSSHTLSIPGKTPDGPEADFSYALRPAYRSVQRNKSTPRAGEAPKCLRAEQNPRINFIFDGFDFGPGTSA